MSETASHLTEKLSDTLVQAEDLGRAAGKKLHEARRGTADALSASASRVRNTGAAIDELAERAAATLDSTAGYVRSHDSGDILAGLRQVVHRHPASFVAGAVAAGFFFGFVFRKRWASLGPRTPMAEG